MKDGLGNTANMYTLEFVKYLILKIALQSNANVDIQNKKGITLLMIATRNDDIEGASIVVNYGNPNPFIKNNSSMSVENNLKNKLKHKLKKK
ncbi:MAG: hypothetical protein ACP5M9_02700 [Candidatus Micrarchaeia archaeon]